MGYFELLASVDKFVFLTDVQYIRRGWVNRNKIPAKHKHHQYITVPVSYASRSALIKDIVVIPGWVHYHKRILEHTYGNKFKSSPIYDLLGSLEHYSHLSELLLKSVIWMSKDLGIDCQFEKSCGISANKGVQKILDICHHFGATSYINLSGGYDLYHQSQFGNIKLNFMRPCSYDNKYSIIDSYITNRNNTLAWLQRCRTDA